jgi:hypothetical protein
MTARRALLVVALALAGCGGIDSFDDFRRQLSARWCDRQIRCGEIGASESVTCAIPTPLGSIGPGIDDLPAGVARHALQFHGGNAQHCLDAVRDAPCDPDQADLAFRRWCHNIVSPLVQTGGACLDSLECQGGSCVVQNGCGQCVAWAPTGGVCDGSGKPELTCDPTVHWCDGGTCAQKKQPGSRCGSDVECVFDYVCVDGRCGDHPRIKEGDHCGPGQPPCRDGLFCDSTGLCTKLLAAGAGCSVPDGCQYGLVCVAGSCAAWSDVDGACTVANDPKAATGCPSTQRCVGGSCKLVDGQHETLAGPDRRCNADSDCQRGLWCQGGLCAYRAGAGGGCLANDACVEQLTCDPTLRECSATGVSCAGS